VAVALLYLTGLLRGFVAGLSQSGADDAGEGEQTDAIAISFFFIPHLPSPSSTKEATDHA
jgi:hypothetical protein